MLPRHQIVIRLSSAILFAAFSLPLRAEDANSWNTVVRPFLNQHCERCHGAKKHEGDLRLDELTSDFDTARTAGIWIEVMDNLNLGEMPPEGEPRPDSKQHAHVVGWIAGELRAAQQRAISSGGRVLLRRLNRTEYANTVRDLLKIEFLPGESPAELLPPDATYDGFDKVGSTLMLDPSLLDNYYRVAQDISSRVMVDGPPEFPTKVAHFEFEETSLGNTAYVLTSPTVRERENDIEIVSGSTRVRDQLDYEGNTAIFPTAGRYTIRVRASADHAGQNAPVTMYVDRVQGREPRLMELEVAESPQTYSVTMPFVALGDITPAPYFSIGLLNGPSGFRQGIPGHSEMVNAAEAAAKAGDFATGLRIQARMLAEGYVDYTQPTKALLDLSKYPKLYLDWMEVEGPLYDAWPPDSHTNLLFKGDESDSPHEYAREIFARLLPRAFRRPVEDPEVDRVAAFVSGELDNGTPFKEAIEVGLTYVLTSPDFLYLLEPGDASTSRRLNDYELASRLSYFLWSSLPDDELFALAESKSLRKPDVLRQQVTRMLADEEAIALTDGFAAQWLRTSEFLNFTPDSRIYRGFDPRLRDDMVGETKAFFREVLTKQLSIFEFLDSDFVMANERLAGFYGLPPVKGDEFRRVPLPADSPRGGLLGQAGVHLLGSDGIRTKPVTRGVYIREVLFNDPPAPPPPNAGEIEPNIEGKRLTVRERLLQHQQIEACANCHRGIDPYGLALENFDATGAWRTRQNGEDFRGENTPPIVVSGTLPNGESFESFADFKSILLRQKDRFRRAFAEKLFVYATGRPVEPRDRPEIETVARQADETGNTIEAIIQALIQTDAFQTK
jgi:hypothetical protein